MHVKVQEEAVETSLQRGDENKQMSQQRAALWLLRARQCRQLLELSVALSIFHSQC